MGFGGKKEDSRGYSPYLHSHSHLLWLEKRIEERRGEEEEERKGEEKRRGEEEKASSLVSKKVRVFEKERGRL